MNNNYLGNEKLILKQRNTPSAYLIHQRQLIMHAVLGFVLLAVIVVVIYFYIDHEHTIYISDYVGYQNITHNIVAQYHHSPWNALYAIALSTTAEYNAIFTIPLLPWMLNLGESRMVFEIALGVMYLLPFSLVLGALAVQLIRARPQAVFWSTVLLTLLTPMVWVPTLRGYPDTGGVVIIALAMYVYLRDTRLKHMWQILLIGFLMTSSILFRRHFAYAALAFFGAMALQALTRFALRVRLDPKLAWHDLRVSIARLGLTACVALVVLITFGRPFLIRFLTTNYNALYAAYLEPPLPILEWYIAAYGWLAVGAAVIGFLLGIRTRIVNPDAATFIVLFGSLTGLAWLLIARQSSEQYTLNFTPTVILGTSALLWTIALRFKPFSRRIAIAGSLAYFSANMILGLTPVAIPYHSIFASLFAMREPPLTRRDQAEVSRLVTYFRDIAGNGEPIYVASSSGIMGKDTLVSAEHIFYGWDGATLNVLYSPEIDSRDYYPLELLLRAQYVLVVEPFQYHVSPERQRIVQVVYDIFKNNREFAHDFVEMPERFNLDNGAVASVYRRSRPTSIPTAIRTLAFMESYVQARPGAQPDWIILDQPPISTGTLNHDHSYLVDTQIATREGLTSTKLLYIGAISDSSVLSGEIAFLGEHCAGVNVRLAHVTKSGKSEIVKEMMRHPQESPNFALAFEKHDPGFFLVTFENIDNQASADVCPLRINHLRFTPN